MIFLLELENKRYYVGRIAQGSPTADPLAALIPEAIEWTRLNRPLTLVEIVPGDDIHAENAHVKRCMARHGIDCVRGGSYQDPVLPAEVVAFLSWEIWDSAGQCHACGGPSHLGPGCAARGGPRGEKRSFAEVVSAPRATPPPRELQTWVSASCSRCGRDGHDVGLCHAATRADGTVLSPAPRNLVCHKCGGLGHYHAQCLS